MPVTIRSLLERKRRGERFAVLTAYDYTTARILAEAEIPVLLVGDSLGMVMLGYRNTLPVTMEEMLHHARAVARGAPDQLLVGDMPFNSYHASDEQAIASAASFLQAGMHAVKVEGGGRVAALVAKLTERGIPVMGHLGLTPQSVLTFGGFKVQAKTREAAEWLIKDATLLQDEGVYALVIEGVPSVVGTRITEALEIPTIGIGAGPDTDGQVLVLHDILGLTNHEPAKFVRQYAQLGTAITEAVGHFAADVRSGAFPDESEAYANPGDLLN